VALVAAFEIAFPGVIVGALAVRFNVCNDSVGDTAKSGARMKVRANIASRCDRKVDGHHFVLTVELSKRA
jgi:hypothetical protein